MNYGDNCSSRNRGCGVCLAVAVMLLILLVFGIRGCMAQIEAEAVYEATREPTAAERRSEEIRDWMLAVGYDEACIIHSGGSSIVEGSFAMGKPIALGLMTPRPSRAMMNESPYGWNSLVIAPTNLPTWHWPRQHRIPPMIITSRERSQIINRLHPRPAPFRGLRVVSLTNLFSRARSARQKTTRYAGAPWSGFAI